MGQIDKQTAQNDERTDRQTDSALDVDSFFAPLTSPSFFESIELVDWRVLHGSRQTANNKKARHELDVYSCHMAARPGSLRWQQLLIVPCNG